MTDEEILALSHNFDNYFSEVIDVTNEDIPYISAILLARLLLANDVYGTGDKFREILETAINTKQKTDFTRH
jgi:hypothetical protein